MKGPFGSPDDAIKDFKKKFQDKTGNKWENRDSFTPKTKKYTMIEMSLEDGDETDAPAPVCLHYYITALHSVRAGIFTLLRLSSPFCTRRYFYIITSCTALHSVRASFSKKEGGRIRHIFDRKFSNDFYFIFKKYISLIEIFVNWKKGISQILLVFIWKIVCIKKINSIHSVGTWRRNTIETLHIFFVTYLIAKYFFPVEKVESCIWTFMNSTHLSVQSKVHVISIDKSNVGKLRLCILEFYYNIYCIVLYINMKTKSAPSGPIEKCTLDAPTQSLVKLIFNHDMFQNAMKSFDIGKLVRSKGSSRGSYM